MKWGQWIPPWVAIKPNVCGVYECSELRHEDEDGFVRRYCKRHAKEYEREARETPEGTKLLRISGSS